MTDPPSGSSDSRDPWVGRILDQRYRVLQCIGRGGMGAVYLAEHLLLRRRVAIKMLHAGLAERSDAVQRFHREAVAAAAVGDEHIIDVKDMGRLEGGQFYIVLEYLAGADLAWVVSSGGPLSVARTLRISLQLCQALGAVHGAGLVHRDLKPENLFLITRAGQADFLKVLDFGVCKLHDASFPAGRRLTHTGMALGTPQYMAPEQVEGRSDIDQRADIYAVGAIVYFALAGVPAFDAPTLPRLFMRICYSAPASLRTLRPDVPEALEAIVLRALAKDRTARFENAAELAAALAPLVHAAQDTPSGHSPRAQPLPAAGEARVVQAAPLTRPTGADTLDQAWASATLPTALPTELPGPPENAVPLASLPLRAAAGLGRRARQRALGIAALAILAGGTMVGVLAAGLLGKAPAATRPAQAALAAAGGRAEAVETTHAAARDTHSSDADLTPLIAAEQPPSPAAAAVPSSAQSGSAPGSAQSGWAQPGSAQTGSAQTGSEPGWAQPGWAQPGSEPGSAQSGWAQPGSAQPGSAQSGSAQSGSEPGSALSAAEGGRDSRVLDAVVRPVAAAVDPAISLGRPNLGSASVSGAAAGADATRTRGGRDVLAQPSGIHAAPKLRAPASRLPGRFTQPMRTDPASAAAVALGVKPAAKTAEPGAAPAATLSAATPTAAAVGATPAETPAAPAPAREAASAATPAASASTTPTASTASTTPKAAAPATPQHVPPPRDIIRVFQQHDEPTR
ncbi:MAG: protein kinase [Polyangiales bacterium]